MMTHHLHLKKSKLTLYPGKKNLSLRNVLWGSYFLSVPRKSNAIYRWLGN